MVHSAEEAMDRYRFLLTHEQERRAIGEAAHARALGEHTTSIVRGRSWIL